MDGEANGRQVATQAGRVSTTKRPLELCLRHHFACVYWYHGTCFNSFVLTDFLVFGLRLIQEKNSLRMKNSSYK